MQIQQLIVLYTHVWSLRCFTKRWKIIPFRETATREWMRPGLSWHRLKCAIKEEFWMKNDRWSSHTQLLFSIRCTMITSRPVGLPVVGRLSAVHMCFIIMTVYIILQRFIQKYAAICLGHYFLQSVICIGRQPLGTLMMAGNDDLLRMFL